MKLTLPSGLLSVVLVSSFAYRAFAQDEAVLQEEKSLATEGEQFWDRFLQGDTSFSYPTAVPTKSPTPAPTLLRSGAECEVMIEIECKTLDGKDCDEIEPPNATSCADGSDISIVTFGYSGNTCNGNNQGGKAYCEDCATIPLEPVTVLCKDFANGSDMVVEPALVNPSDTFTVSAPGGGALPEKIDCIFVDSDGIKSQQNIIDTSGDVILDLKDEFGAFTLLSCGAVSCLEVLCYDIDIVNVGQVVVDILMVDFIFNGDLTILPGDVNPLQPGSSTSLASKRQVDICSSGEEFCAETNVQAASPPNGPFCLDTEQYKFSVLEAESLSFEAESLSFEAKSLSFEAESSSFEAATANLSPRKKSESKKSESKKSESKKSESKKSESKKSESKKAPYSKKSASEKKMNAKGSSSYKRKSKIAPSSKRDVKSTKKSTAEMKSKGS